MECDSSLEIVQCYLRCSQPSFNLSPILENVKTVQALPELKRVVPPEDGA